MRVSELKVGELYKIRSDRKTPFVRRGMLDVHVGMDTLREHQRSDLSTILSILADAGKRWAMYRGEKLRCLSQCVATHRAP